MDIAKLRRLLSAVAETEPYTKPRTDALCRVMAAAAEALPALLDVAEAMECVLRFRDRLLIAGDESPDARCGIRQLTGALDKAAAALRRRADA